VKGSRFVVIFQFLTEIRFVLRKTIQMYRFIIIYFNGDKIMEINYKVHIQ